VNLDSKPLESERVFEKFRAIFDTLRRLRTEMRMVLGIPQEFRQALPSPAIIPADTFARIAK